MNCADQDPSEDHPQPCRYDTVKYAYLAGSIWVSETIASTGPIIGYEGTSLEIDSRGMPHIAYFHHTAGLMYTYAKPELSFLPLVLRNHPQFDRYAVIVGVADYLYDDGHPITPCLLLADLPYPDDDASNFRSTLINRGGFDPANILMLTDSQATKSAIENAITSWLDSREDADDQVVFYFAGHGMRDNEVFPYDETDNMDEYLIPHDWVCDLDSAIADDELDSWLDNLESQHITLLFDSCHSGGMIETRLEGEQDCRCRCLPPVSGVIRRPATADGFASDVDQAGRLILTASAEDEQSWECDSLQSGVFSYYLRRALRAGSADTNGNGWVSGEEAFVHLVPGVMAEPCYLEWQNPQISDGTSGEEDLTQP